MATTTLPSACCSSPSLKVSQNGITRDARPCPFAPPISPGYLTDVGTLLGWCARDGVAGEKFLKAWGLRSEMLVIVRFTKFIAQDMFGRPNPREPGTTRLFCASHALCGGHLLLRARRRGCQGVARIVQRAGSPHRSCPDGRCRGWPGPCDQEQDRLKGQGVKISACCSQ